MDDKVGFVLKVLLLSLGFAIVIKHLAPQLEIPATLTNALLAVLLPSLLLAIALAWRLRKADVKE